MSKETQTEYLGMLLDRFGFEKVALMGAWKSLTEAAKQEVRREALKIKRSRK